MSHASATPDLPTQPAPTAPPEPAPSSSAPAPAINLTNRATSGFIFFAMQTAAFKAVSLVGQIVLAWILTEEDFGLFALCGTAATFIELLPQGGLKEVLTRRKHAFRAWAPAAFWISLLMGLLAAGLMAGSGPVLARFYGAPELVGLMAVLALSCPVQGLNTVPMARLQMDLRFRTLASVAAVSNIGVLVLTIVFALLDMGPYSFVLPRAIMPVVQGAIVWSISGARVSPKLRLRRWPYLASGSTILLLTYYLNAAITQGDRIVLGRWTSDPAVVGVYAFALFISLQTLQIVTVNLEQIFFATLCEIRNDARRQAAAFVRAARVLSVAAAPACFFQAALADPLIRMVFQPRWHPAIPAAQILSIGMAVLACTLSATSLMRAQGRFRTLVVLSSFGTGLYFAAVLGGAALAGPGRALLGVAAGVSLYNALMGLINMTVALRVGATTAAAFRGTLSVLAGPMGAAGAAIGGAWAAAQVLPEMPGRRLAEVAVIVGVGGPLYLALLRLVTPVAWADARERVQAVLARVRRRPGAA